MDRLYTILLNDGSLKHESDRTVDLLRALGVTSDGSVADVAPRRRLGDRSAQALLGEVNPLPIMAVSPSGGHSALKAWPVAQFADVVRRMVDSQCARVVLLGARNERALARQLIELAAVPVLDLVGELTLAETVTVLDSCALFLGNDTGLLHLAAARNVATVSIYGSSPAAYFGPRGPQHHVIWNRLSCSPLPPGAITYQSHGDALPAERCSRCIYSTPKCLDEITPDVVWDACISSITSRKNTI